MIQLVRVLIDSREPQWVQELRWHVPSGVQALPVGDAWLMVCDAVLAVERKTLDDFCASIADGRLFTQATEMQRATPWCYEVITGMPHNQWGHACDCGASDKVALVQYQRSYAHPAGHWHRCSVL